MIRNAQRPHTSQQYLYYIVPIYLASIATIVRELTLGGGYGGGWLVGYRISGKPNLGRLSSIAASNLAVLASCFHRWVVRRVIFSPKGFPSSFWTSAPAYGRERGHSRANGFPLRMGSCKTPGDPNFRFSLSKGCKSRRMAKSPLTTVHLLSKCHR